MSDDKRGGKPYLWVTWVTGYLSGYAKCAWASWYRAHYRFAKRPRDNAFDLDEWRRDHDKMVLDRRELLTADGYSVTTESRNGFKLEGRTVIVAGKPDIVARKPGDVLIVDEKSGEPKAEHTWQVRLYMFAWRRLRRGAGDELARGELEYRGGARIAVSPDSLDGPTIEHIARTMMLVGGDAEPPRTPSAEECARCDILYCPDRIVVEPAVADVKDF